MYDNVEIEKGEYTTKSGLTDCVYKNKINSKIKTEDYKVITSRSLLDSSEIKVIDWR